MNCRKRRAGIGALSAHVHPGEESFRHMVILLAAILAIAGFIVLTRLLWLTRRPSMPTTVVTIAALSLIVGLAVLAATGRMHWIAALGAAIIPFTRRAFSLLRYLPIFRGLFGAYQQYGNKSGGAGGSAGGSTGGSMSLDQAREILGLGPDPSRDEIISAHRRLMQKVHPDRGGSDYLAQQLNEARRVLLKAAP